MTPQLDLFGGPPQQGLLRLPDAELTYRPAFFAKADADRLFARLLETVQWRQDTMHLMGKPVPLPRLSAWYGDTDKPYTYSGITLQPLAWTPELLEIKTRLEQLAGAAFSSVLLNRYRSGADHIGWHTDAEPSLGRNPVIGSVNFGAERRFQLRRRDDATVRHEFVLGHGTVLVMAGATQHHWQHRVPKTAAPVGERLNLTFRLIR